MLICVYERFICIDYNCFNKSTQCIVRVVIKRFGNNMHVNETLSLLFLEFFSIL